MSKEAGAEGAVDPWERFHAKASRGLRTEGERDRDRILYSSAFQRLVGITQVASPETGASFHNRLTHSIKVAQVGRRVAQALKILNGGLSRPSPAVTALDPDAVEAACLAHDLGHPPFGHIAEVELNHLASGYGGFEGNAQSFRIVTELALRELRYPGLNLSRATLNGILKYPWMCDPSDDKMSRKWGAYASEQVVFDWVRRGSPPAQRSLGAEVMDWADDVTYAVHDLEDFYRVGIVPLGRLTLDDRERNEFVDAFFTDPTRKTLREKFADDGLKPKLVLDAADFLFGPDSFLAASEYGGTTLDRVTTRARSSALIDRYITAVEVRARPNLDGSWIRIDERRRAEVAVLKELTWRYVITRPSLETLHHGQRSVIRRLHRIYTTAARREDLILFPALQRDQLRDDPGNLRIVTDFVASLTEEMAYELHYRLTGQAKGSILDAAAMSAR